MQKILYDRNKGNVFLSEMLRLYSLFSDPDSSSDEPFRPCAKPFVDELRRGCDKDVRYADSPTQMELKPDERRVDGNKVVVCFSGGKDSVATALRCRETGYGVELYHVHGINHSYPDEIDRARDIADYLRMPLHVETVRLSGKPVYFENPLKNQTICAMALDWSERNGHGRRIAFGDFRNDHRERAIFGTNWTDTVEMWDAYTQYAWHDYDGFEALILFDNYFQTMDVVAQDRTLLGMVQGCIAPSRYREYWRGKNVAKYGEGVILPHRCGSCWKCCREYVHLADDGVLPMDGQYYRKCQKVLRKKRDEI